jgi:hypothetical protein
MGKSVLYEVIYDEDPTYLSRQWLYMAPGVGLVRWREFEKVDGAWLPTYQDSLLRYDLKPAEAPAEAEAEAPAEAELAD